MAHSTGVQQLSQLDLEQDTEVKPPNHPIHILCLEEHCHFPHLFFQRGHLFFFRLGVPNPRHPPSS